MGKVQFNDSKVLFTSEGKVAMGADCCCGGGDITCANCDSGDGPEEFLVTINITDEAGDCDCSAANDDYVVPFLIAQTGYPHYWCRWGNETFDETGTGCFTGDFRIAVTIKYVFPGYDLTVALLVSQYNPGCRCIYWNTHFDDLPACMDFDELAIPYTSSLEDLPGGGNCEDLCNFSGTTCTITAIS